jgi:hypothetical protein
LGLKSKSLRYRELMPNRVREVLLVSTRYDAFVLQEDGHLTEQIFLEYKELSLSSSPRVTHAPTFEAALSMLQANRYDLVLLVSRVADHGVVDFAKKVKTLFPSRPVIVLGFDPNELDRLRPWIDPSTIDAAFVWSGDAKILLAIIKRIEDRQNLDNDIEAAGVRIILVIEDSIHYTSAFLSGLYPELMKQSQSLFAEGFNRLQKLYRMRTRPKVLLASNYEEAVSLFERYHENILSVITDVGFPRQGALDPEAGLLFISEVRRSCPDLPVLIQSAEEKYAKAALEQNALFVNKTNPDLLTVIRGFLNDYLGFGAFIFRLPGGDEVARAKDVRELLDCVHTVPDESLLYHASHNHFSAWLLARSEFTLANKLHPKTVGDFKTVKELREFLSQELESLRRVARAGVITDFSTTAFEPEGQFQRIGDGSLGGKARSIAFLDALLSTETDDGQLEGLKICIPQTFVITTEFFDRFIEENRLSGLDADRLADEEIAAAFLSAKLPSAVVQSLLVILKSVRDPLAVRSSSLMEDDMLHPLAGIYKTLMIPNNDPELDVRLRALCRAIQEVYASTYFKNARAYLKNVGRRREEEKMAVVIQRVVGQRHGRRFYPQLSGVAHSYNYYPLGPLAAEDGVVQMALGLGRMVVDGGACVRFCPKYPGVMPQFSNPSLVLKNSQKAFYALDLDRRAGTEGSSSIDDVVLFDLSSAVEDGTMPLVGSVFDAENHTITEGVGVRGPWVVTFNNILKYQSIPLAGVLSHLLKLTSESMGTAVEIEFACDCRKPPVLYLLQVRPILAREDLQELQQETLPSGDPICFSRHALGHGCFSGLRDVVYVRNENFDPATTLKIAQQVGQINEQLVREDRPYLLMGPGRWGSSDAWLGIPVQWSQISGAKIIVEASPEGYNVEPSQGTHFFHNITSLQLGYLTILPGGKKTDGKTQEFVDWDWLNAQPAFRETEYLRHIRSEQPLVATLDGRKGLGVVFCPPTSSCAPTK